MNDFFGAARRGTVYLVGAGPGDAGLITQRALQLVRSADVLFIDRLVPRELAEAGRGDAARIDVGKTAGDHAMPQEQINERIVEEALAGRSVVRIKGGDPYLFGRGGEEAIACRDAGVPFEVVPAVTSAFAACADAGIPVTHRDIARNVTVVTASAGRDGQGDPDYGWLAQSDGTVVLLMGLRRIGHVAQRLIEAGAPADRPVAVISRGTTSEQRTVTGTLASIAAVVAEAQLPSPAIIVVGDVVHLRDQLNWFERRPLFGTRIAVTRARAQSSTLAAALTELGAQVVEVPTIRIERLDPAPLDAAIAELAPGQTLVLTSVNGGEALFDRLAATGNDARRLFGVRIAVVGDATAELCRRHGIVADLLPPEGARTSAGLLQELRRERLDGHLVTIVRAEHGDDTLLDGLRDAGAHVALVAAYRTVVDTATPEQVAALVAADLVTFSSASTVRHAVAMAAGAPLPPAITIGPTTTAAADVAGLTVLGEARVPGVPALVDAVLAHVTQRV